MGDQKLQVQEEQSRDDEIAHAVETVAVLQIDWHVFAQDVSTRGTDPSALRRRGTTSAIAISGIPGGDLAYLHTDHLGAVVKATDQYQDIVWDAVCEPFGRRVVTVNQLEMPLGFPGQYYDQESGNFYNYFSDYDPTTGRYLQSDPIGLSGGIDTYAYVLNNPLRWIDVFGLVTLDFFASNTKDQLFFNPIVAPDGETYVKGHGNENGVLDQRMGQSKQNAHRLTPNELAEFIRNHGWNPGEPVKLLVCNSGDENYYQELANELGVPVTAPNGYVQTDGFGHYNSTHVPYQPFFTFGAGWYTAYPK